MHMNNIPKNYKVEFAKVACKIIKNKKTKKGLLNFYIIEYFRELHSQSDSKGCGKEIFILSDRKKTLTINILCSRSSFWEYYGFIINYHNIKYKNSYIDLRARNGGVNENYIMMEMKNHSLRRHFAKDNFLIDKIKSML